MSYAPRELRLRNSPLKKMLRCRYLYLMFLPVVLYYLIFCYIPMFGIVIAFKKYDIFLGVFKSEWVGTMFFEQFFTSVFCFRLIRNTLLINFYGLIFGFPAPIILALMFNELKNGVFKKISQTISYLPHFVSTVVIVGIYVTFLSPQSGLINNIIRLFGGDSVYFLADPKYFRTLYTVMNIWKGVGWGSIIYLAALTNVDPQLYEACTIDGGGKWRQMFHITLPGISGTVIIMLIFRVGEMMNVGSEAILLMYAPTTYETADVISTYVYRKGLLDADYSFSTAVGLFNSVISMTLLVTTNAIAKRAGEMSLW